MVERGSTKGAAIANETAVEAVDWGTEEAAKDQEVTTEGEDAIWMEVLAAVAMAEKAADNRARAGAVRAENPLSQQMGSGAEATTRGGAAVADKVQQQWQRQQ